MRQGIWAGMILAVMGYFMLQNSACTHEPIFVDPIDPIDTTMNPIDTMPIDTTPFIPCDEGVVYFEYDVLPILIANCSVPGCHDATSQQDGINLTTYESVMSTGKIKPFDLDGSDVFEVITEDDEDKRMPQPPQLPLTQEQIQVIATWILQGAQDLTCDLAPECDSTDVSFSQTIFPIIQTNCRGCHGGPNPQGGISLSDYAGVRSVALSGQLYGAVARLPGFTPMPRNRGPLQDCEIAQIKAWVDAGALNN